MRNFERALQISLANLHSAGKLFFTPRQLFYEFCRAQSAPPGLEPKTAAALFGLSMVPALLFGRDKPKRLFTLLATSAAAFGTLSVFRQIPYSLSPPASRSEFEDSLSTVRRRHKIEGLLETSEKADFVESVPVDLTLYGLPKLLICQGDEIAQMLRANQFHLETPCAVLSLREARPLGETFQKMLSRAENPQVYFLHDASSRAFSLIPNLRQLLSLKREIPLRPLGLRPLHAKRLHLFAEKTQNNAEETLNFQEINYLTEIEKRWLENGFTAEVAAVPPVRLLRVLRRIILGFEPAASSAWQFFLPPRNFGFM